MKIVRSIILLGALLVLILLQSCSPHEVIKPEFKPPINSKTVLFKSIGNCSILMVYVDGNKLTIYDNLVKYGSNNNVIMFSFKLSHTTLTYINTMGSLNPTTYKTIDTVLDFSENDIVLNVVYIDRVKQTFLKVN